MSHKKLKLGIAVALSGVLAAQSCKSQAQNGSGEAKEPNNKKDSCSTDSLRLEKSLLKLSKTKYNGELSTGAMCYAPPLVEFVSYTCPYCNTVVEEKCMSWQAEQLNTIDQIVQQIQKSGYDAILDRSEFCNRCSKHAVEKPELIFKIRFSDNARYHEVRSNIAYEYQCLLAFIQEKDKFSDLSDSEHTLHDNIHIIQKMTGLGKGIEKGSF